MRNGIYILLLLFLASCSSVKRSENNLSKGNYDKAITLSIKKLQKSRNKKSDKQHILLLEEAFEKVVERDISRIQLMQKENNPENTEDIYKLYQKLDYRQERIRPLLPLQGANFKIEDYTDEIVVAKNDYVSYLFHQGSDYLAINSIPDARRAHHYFRKIKKIEPNYLKIDSLLEEAHFQGTDFVHVVIRNRTQQIIPKRLEAAILDFNTYKLDDYWTEYHSAREQNIDYNFGIVLDIREILISPERVNEKEFERTKEVADGWEYVLDENGNVKKDSLGNDIKVDVFKELKAKVIVSTQDKSVLVGGHVFYRDLKANKNISKFPIVSEFLFENIFAEYEGNRGALLKEDRELMRNAYVDFPSNEQMVFDTSTDLKRKFAAILKQKSFR